MTFSMAALGATLLENFKTADHFYATAKSLLQNFRSADNLFTACKSSFHESHFSGASLMVGEYSFIRGLGAPSDFFLQGARTFDMMQDPVISSTYTPLATRTGTPLSSFLLSIFTQGSNYV